MTVITTVNGSIPPGELGLTSMHEHTICDMSIFRRRYESILPDTLPVKADDPVRLDNLSVLKHIFILSRDNMDLTDEDLITAEVADFAASGGKAMVDMSTPGIRSNISAIQRISQKTGVHIIATTGLYTEDSWPEQFKSMTVEDYERYMLAEVESGIEGTSIKAGAIKIAITDASLFTAPPFSEQQKLALRAAVRVANTTGLSLSVHPPLDFPENVRQVVKLMLQEGMDPGKVVIAHNELFFVTRKIPILVMDPASWRLNVDFARELLDQGFNLSIDSFGHYHDAEPLGEIITNDWQRLAGVVALLKAGYSSQIVLGTDIFLKILTRRYGGEGYCRLTNFVIPTLHQLDIPASDIQKMIIENPARILAH